MVKRINIVLPEDTLAVLNRIAPRGNRSQFITKAVLHYVKSHGEKNLKEQLKAGYEANAEENLKMAAEWFPLEEEAWELSENKRR